MHDWERHDLDNFVKAMENFQAELAYMQNQYGFGLNGLLESDGLSDTVVAEMDAILDEFSHSFESFDVGDLSYKIYLLQEYVELCLKEAAKE